MLLRNDLIWELLVLRPSGGTFELLHRSEVPGYTAMARDAGARHIFLYSASPLFLTPLGPTAPELPRAEAKPSPWIDDVAGAPSCLGSAGARAEAYRKVVDAVRVLSRDVIMATSVQLQREGTTDMVVERARALAAAVEDGDAPAEADRLRKLLWEHHPENARVRVLRADDQARLGRWDEVRDALASCTPAAFAGDEDHAQHSSHLRALAALHLGDVEGARRHAAEAAEHAGSCRLEGLAAVLRPQPDPRTAAREPTEDPPLLTQLAWAIHAADARLHAGDPEGALAALDPQRFDIGDEVQVLARRAEAWLALPPPPGRRRFAKIVSLARLLQADEGEPDDERDELPVPGAWDRSRLDDVIGRAAAWLAAQAKAAQEGAKAE